VHGGNAILTTKKGNYREGCTYLRREEINIINKLCSLETLLRYEVLYIQPKSQEQILHILVASLTNIILLITFAVHIILKIRLCNLSYTISFSAYIYSFFTLCTLHKLIYFFIMPVQVTHFILYTTLILIYLSIQPT